MTHTLNHPTSFAPFARLRAAIDTYKANRAYRAAYDVAYTKLHRISDAELTEFGLYRSDLSEIARVEAAKA